ncbi:CHAT domain-containing protein [Micromonospora sp. PSH03]|uniref:CHAT domain-containing protein n=1 Tax=Micromonospora salmantinae TaxID=2911211 RepID=UPI001EE90F44|nr:CHAT domain-containing protein [Micromonospora salmantinae]MCG5454504.1 CHAT domain-containing protein [Micromonospora salmantinae]
MTLTVTEAVRRSLARDTLLMLAHEAEEAMIVVRNRDRTAMLLDNEHALFQLAVDRYLLQADSERDLGAGQVDLNWAFRSNGNADAATILRFCAHMGIRLSSERDIDGLYRKALAELRPSGEGQPALDRLAEVTTTCRLARSLRAADKVDEALRLSATLGPDFFYASGAEPRYADIQFELGACLLEGGRPAQVFSALGELQKTYWETTEAASFSTRHRYGFILALADRALGRTNEAITRLEAALKHLAEHRVHDTRHDAYELSLTLSCAELLAASGAHRDRAADLAKTALDIAEQIRGRWGVIARTRTPLSRAFRRVYGDVALLAAELRGAAAARLGLRVCLSAKQTGFAGHMRAGEPLLPPRLRGLIAEVLAAEEPASDAPTDADSLSEQRQEQARTVAELHDRIQKRVNPMLADMVLPTPTDMGDLLRVIGKRHALDFAGLPDTLSAGTNWFRTFIEPGGDVQFQRFTTGEHFARYFEGRDGHPPWNGRLDEADTDDQPDWHGLAAEILPAELLRRLRDACSDEEPLELVVSAHLELSLLPWAALVIGPDGTRLIHRAVLTQTPMLTCLSAPHPPAVAGPGLVRLVSDVEDGVWIERESEAWGFALSPEQTVPLSRCTLDDQAPQGAAHTRVSAMLTDPDEDWRFIHIATHGDGEGLAQYLMLPEETATEGQLSAAHALALRWPESALMASCHVGRLVNIEDAEPLSFVTAVLTGGSRCIVAAIDSVPDQPAGRMAGHLVQLVRAGNVRLDHALRRAQLDRVDEDHVVGWALFNAYVR